MQSIFRCVILRTLVGANACKSAGIFPLEFARQKEHQLSTMKNNEVSIIHILKYAGAFAACAIGSGFATGQEIMQFFSAYGQMGVLGTIVTTILFTWCGATFMRHGYKHNLTKPRDCAAFYFGEKAGPVIEVIFQVFLFGVLSIMIAGAGATMSEYFGISPMVGRIGMCVLAMITVVLGLQKFTDILGSLGPAIVICAIFIGFASIVRNGAQIPMADVEQEAASMTKVEGGWLWSALLYPAFNAIVVIFLSCCIGSTATSEKEATWGGVAGGLIFGGAIIVMNLGLLADLASVSQASVPTLTLAREISPLIATVFSVIICIGIYTTIVPSLWGIVRHFAADGTKKSAYLTVFLSALGLALGLTDFKVLVNTIYPFSGYAGLVLFCFMLWRNYRDRHPKIKSGE